ncbi:MAG: NUMOD3 domain-containing DNA-binding protein [Elusimicrobia bacterium]|nr:NUMOD3 domain-containing DNA-binding protein [Elusimicrobiota bacterium]
MSLLGKHHSEESKRKMSESHKGKHPSEEARRKNSESHKGNKHPLYGKHRSDETKRKISKAHKGKHHSEETRRKMSETRKGNKNPFYEKHHSEQARKKISEANRGEKSYNWKGGKSFEPYSTDWTETLRRSIRERDHYICQICGALQGDKAFDIHHIDYNKENCDPNNLITLCHNCHSRTNHNREYWIKFFFQKKLY